MARTEIFSRRYEQPKGGRAGTTRTPGDEGPASRQVPVLRLVLMSMLATACASDDSDPRPIADRVGGPSRSGVNGDGPPTPSASRAERSEPDEKNAEPAVAFDANAAWKEFENLLRENYAYLQRADFDFDEQLRHSKELAQRATSSEEFRATLHRTTFAFTDPHFTVEPLADDDPNIVPTASDLAIELRDGKYMVVDVRAQSPADTTGIRPGWELIEVDGLPVGDAIERVWNGVVLARTDRQRSYAATLVANGSRKREKRRLVFSVDGRREPLEIQNPRDFAETVKQRPPLTVEISDGVAFIRIENSLGHDDTIAAFDDALEALPQTKALVLDLRNTPSGGNSDIARSIIGHFITEERPYQMHEVPAVVRRCTVPRRFVEHVLPREPRYDGPVAVLGGRWTGSMGEGVVIGMDGAAGAHTIASDMGDLLGAVHDFELKHAPVHVRFAAEALFHVDGTPRELFEADVPVASADRDAEGNDPTSKPLREWIARAARRR